VEHAQRAAAAQRALADLRADGAGLGKSRLLAGRRRRPAAGGGVRGRGDGGWEAMAGARAWESIPP